MNARIVITMGLALSLAACLRDLGADQGRYACVDDSECLAGWRCVPTTGPLGGECRPDDGVTPTPAYLCQPCATDAACGEGRCTQLPDARFCTSACQTNADCPSGYFCFALGVGEPRCVPARVTTCAACLQDPCPEGQYCDQAADQCRSAVGTCGACVHDPECGPGARCVEFGLLDRRCVPECGAGCPENSACRTLSREQGTEGARACVPDTSDCCFGPDCGCHCSAGQICLEGVCVECVSDLQCPLDRPLCQDGACRAGSCEDATPYPCWQSATGCCECTTNAHCGGGASCDLGLGTCGVLPPGCTCAPPYQVCALRSGDPTCVECLVDGDCGQGCTCDTWQQRCVHGAGDFCAATCGSECLTDADCPAATGFALTCDAAGCCRDLDGGCDNAAAFCTVAGSTCTSIADVLKSGGSGTAAMAAPGGVDLDGDGLVDDSLPAGYCSCTRSVVCGGFDFAGGPAGNDKESFTPVCCPSGQRCVEVVQLLSFLQGTALDLTPVLDDGPGVCFPEGTFAALGAAPP